jgi:hypothetical protein
MKPRNQVVLDLIKNPKKAGKHKKSFKALRRKQKMKLREETTQH